MKTFEENKQTLDLFFKPLVEDKERGSEVRAVDMVAWNQLSKALEEEKIVEISTEKNEECEIIYVEFINKSFYTQEKWLYEGF